MTKRLKQLNQALFWRSYLLTAGLLMFLGAGFVGYLALNEAIELAWWGAAFTGVVILIGIALLGLGLVGSHARMEGWADNVMPSHEGAIVLIVISYPVYLILKQFYRPK